MTIDQKIEAVLFFKTEPVGVGVLAKMLEVGEDEIKAGLTSLEEKFTDRGVQILYKEDKVMLGTATEASDMIESLIKEELSKDLGKAGLETLSTVLYYGPIARNKIDYVRGVSSTFILRNLLVRGLVERVTNPKDQRSFLYKPTFELLSYLGVVRVEDLPEFKEVRSEIEAFEANRESSQEKNEDEK